jgi:hypothetical protein
MPLVTPDNVQKATPLNDQNDRPGIPSPSQMYDNVLYHIQAHKNKAQTRRRY